MTTRSSANDLFQDWSSNKGNIKAQLVLLSFRLAQRLRATKHWRRNPLVIGYGVVYRVVVEWILGIEIPWKTRIGSGLVLYHGIGLVINDSAVIGSGVTLRHNVTIGTKVNDGPAPRIGDNVTFGCGATILGDIEVGEGAVIGAGAVVTKDVPPGAVAVGNPARIRIPAQEETDAHPAVAVGTGRNPT